MQINAGLTNVTTNSTTTSTVPGDHTVAAEDSNLAGANLSHSDDHDFVHMSLSGGADGDNNDEEGVMESAVASSGALVSQSRKDKVNTLNVKLSGGKEGISKRKYVKIMLVLHRTCTFVAYKLTFFKHL